MIKIIKTNKMTTFMRFMATNMAISIKMSFLLDKFNRLAILAPEYGGVGPKRPLKVVPSLPRRTYGRRLEGQGIVF